VNAMRYVIWTLVTLTLAAASAQEKPDAAEVLRRVTTTYSNATQYQLAGEQSLIITSVKDGAVTSRTVAATAIALRQPDRIRVEMTGDGPEDVLIVSDGRAAWAYSPKANEYMKLRPGRVPNTPLIDSDVTDDLKVPYMMQMAQQALEFFKFPPQPKASVVGEETLAVKGSAFACIVVSIEDRPFPKSTTRLWIDKSRNVVVREDVRTVSGLVIESSSTTYSTVRINEPLPDELFQFTPPPGSKLVEDFDR
jgi:outer membrane lipoprotein-sorting protein